jgi:hypothetical protein
MAQLGHESEQDSMTDTSPIASATGREQADEALIEVMSVTAHISLEDLYRDTPSIGGVSSQIYDLGSVGIGIRDIGGACRFNVQRQSSSGPLITTPKVVLLWWSTYFWNQHSTEKNYYKAALNAVGNDPAFWNRLNEYGITSGSYSGTIDLTRFGGPSASVNEQDIQNMLTFRFNNLVNPPDENSIYVILLPNGITSAYNTSNGFIGHHQFYQYNGKNIRYGVVEYSTNTTQTLSVITHEVYEAVTDPDLSTGYWDPADGNNTEIGDLCNLQTMMMDGYPVQQVWSQQACGCK